MDERRVRYTAGRNGDGTVHRVGLTRHCLASGRIQLPFALRETIPEGELLAHDVDRDATWVLESLPPRRLAGLRPFFEAHELQVNDLLELRMSGEDVRLACVRRARREAPAEERAADASSGGASSAAGARPVRRDAVVDRIGSVTVRRLGAGTFASPAAAALPDPAPEAPADSAAAPDAAPPAEPPSAAPVDAPAPHPAEAEPEEPVPLLADAEPTPVQATTPRPPEAAREAATDGAATSAPAGRAAEQVGLFGAAPRGAPDRRRPRPGRGPAAGPAAATQDVPVPRAAEPAPVRESDLLDAAEARSADRSGRDAPVLGWLRRPSAGRERVQTARAAPSRPTPRPAPREPVESAAPAGERVATPPDVRRAREEALSRAGDLRSRMVRWLLDPRTPVIVQHERVQHEFGLEPGVARDVLGGIVEDPPPSLRLTVLREGLIRVSRMTVEQEA